MPIPEPKETESQSEFINRCMSDEKLKEEFPDNIQRLAICYEQYKK